MPSSRVLDGNVSLADVAPLRDGFARRIGPCFSSSTGFRSQNVNTAAGYDAFLTYLNAGLAAAFIELCAAASDVCTDCCYCDACLVSMR